MVSESSFEIYKSSGLEGKCHYTFGGGIPMIDFPDDGDYVGPLDETDEIFLDRIERSKQVGRNLFKEEWKLDPISRGIDMLY